jgi:hypothetical protein
MMSRKSWFAGVLAGVVLAAGFCATPSLQAAEKKPARTGASQGEKVFGIVTAKTDKDITIKAEGENDAKCHLLAPRGGAPKADVQTALKMVFPTNLAVRHGRGLEWARLSFIQENAHVPGIQMFAPRRAAVMCAHIHGSCGAP